MKHLDSSPGGLRTIRAGYAFVIAGKSSPDVGKTRETYPVPFPNWKNGLHSFYKVDPLQNYQWFNILEDELTDDPDNCFWM